MTPCGQSRSSLSTARYSGGSLMPSPPDGTTARRMRHARQQAAAALDVTCVTSDGTEELWGWEGRSLSGPASGDQWLPPAGSTSGQSPGWLVGRLDGGREGHSRHRSPSSAPHRPRMDGRGPRLPGGAVRTHPGHLAERRPPATARASAPGLMVDLAPDIFDGHRLHRYRPSRRPPGAPRLGHARIPRNRARHPSPGLDHGARRHPVVQPDRPGSDRPRLGTLGPGPRRIRRGHPLHLQPHPPPSWPPASTRRSSRHWPRPPAASRNWSWPANSFKGCGAATTWSWKAPCVTKPPCSSVE